MVLFPKEKVAGCYFFLLVLFPNNKRKKYHVMNRPGEARAVLQTPLLLINYQTRAKPGAALQTPLRFIHSFIHYVADDLSKYLYNVAKP